MRRSGAAVGGAFRLSTVMGCDPGRRFLEAAPGVRHVARIRALSERLRSPADVDALDRSELLNMRVRVRRVTRQASVFTGPLNAPLIEVAGGACRERLVKATAPTVNEVHPRGDRSFELEGEGDVTPGAGRAVIIGVQDETEVAATAVTRMTWTGRQHWVCMGLRAHLNFNRGGARDVLAEVDAPRPLSVTL